MSRTVFYDPVSGKTIIDFATKTLAEVKSEFGFGTSTQEVIVEDDEADEFDSGTLKKFNSETRGASIRVTKETARAGKETSIRAKLGLSAVEFQDLKQALG